MEQGSCEKGMLMFGNVIDIVLGSFFIVLSLIPGFGFNYGRLGTRQKPTSLGDAWVGRVIFGLLGLGIALEGLKSLRHH
jgi:hypothetical protein